LNFLQNFKIFRYFSQGEGTREERKMLKQQIREQGKQEALKRGKVLDEYGNVKKKIE
jgi:hypothetical protein